MTAQLTRRDALQTLALAGAGAISGARPAGAVAPSAARQIDVILQTAVAQGHAPGVVAMAANDRAILYEGAFGPRCVGAPPRMTTDTVFRIASMVKPLTSVAAMQLVERGKLNLDEP